MGEGRSWLVAKGGLKEHSDTKSSAMPPVVDLDWHNSQGRPGLPLESV